jgi:SOS regulatory protein LexA
LTFVHLYEYIDFIMGTTPSDLDKVRIKLKEFYNRHQRLPTHGEMVKLFHYSSRGSSHYLVKKLIEAGIVAKDENGRLIPKDLLGIPVLGIIKAGYPMEANVQQDNYLRLHLLFERLPADIFALQVSGDSMIDEGIYEGDYVLVDSHKEVKNGDIVAANVDGEWTVKYLRKNDDRVVLEAANKKYPLIIPKVSLEIGGVVVHVIRSYR